MKSRSILLFFLTGLLLISACQPTLIPTASGVPSPESVRTEEPVIAAEAAENGRGWWNDVVFYEIFVRSFMDSNGDGIGDFQGIISKLDYLNDGDPNTTTDLGIGGIWLMPIMPSPSYHGYDITDYKAVNPQYGTMEDFQQLLEECHKRGIRVIIDFVINHTSDKHPWFQAALQDKDGYKDWYVWREEKPSTMGPWGQPAWHKVRDDLYYYGIFWSGMPDLNFKTQAVSDALYDISDFWLDVGVDGFRVDAARYLDEEGAVLQDAPGTLLWFQNWRRHIKARNAEVFSVGEVWTDLKTQSAYNQPRGLDSLFIFDTAENILGSVFAPDPSRIIKSYQDTLAAFPDSSFSTFLTNHDQQRVASFYGNNVNKEKQAAFIYLTGPGVPFVYYGEEIGMTGNKPDEFLRTPMQWTKEENAGFTSAEQPWQAINEGYEDNNVHDMKDDPESLLNWYRQIIQVRNQHPALRTGSYQAFISSCRTLYSTLRVEGEEIILTALAVGTRTAENCTLTLEGSNLKGSYQVETLFGKSELTSITFGEDGSLKDFLLADQLNGGEALILKLKP